MLNHIYTIWEYRDFLTIHKSRLDVSQLTLLKSKYRPLYLNYASLIFLSLPISCFFFILVKADLAPQSFITKKKLKNKPAKGEKLINLIKDDTSSICDKYRNGA